MKKDIRPVYYIYCDWEHDYFEWRHSGHTTTYNSITFLEQMLKSDEEALIFVNSLALIVQLFPDGIKKGEKSSIKHDMGLETLKYTYGKKELRSFSALYNNVHTEDLCDMYDTDCVTYGMEQYICAWGDPHKVIWSLAHMALKRFYDDIECFLVQDRRDNKRYFNTLTEYNLCYCGSKAGLLFGDKGYTTAVDGYDLKSAYASVFVNDNRFPIGKIRTTSNYAVFLDEMKKDHWVKVVFYDKVEELELFYDEKLNWTGLEYWDLKALKLFGKDLKDFFDIPHIFLYTDRTDYVHGTVRGKIMKLYDEKSRLKKGTIDREITKVQLEMLYGKGLQWHDDWQTDADMKDYYKPRKKTVYTKYILPQMSLHAVSAVRYQMIKVACDMGEEKTLYVDTDGLKIKHDAENQSYFAALNEKIRAKNIRAGYDSDIGTWDHEGTFDEFSVFALKSYCYRIGEDITLKLAGADRYYKEYVMGSDIAEIGYDRVVRMWSKNGFPTVQKAYKITDGKVEVVFYYGEVVEKWLEKRQKSCH